MAKSIRSKSRRRMRNVTRKHFAKKELALLYKSVKTGQDELAETVQWKIEKKAQDSVTVSTDTDKEDTTNMDIDKTLTAYNQVTKRDENGHYPPWMNQRSVKKHKKMLAGKKNKGKSRKW